MPPSPPWRPWAKDQQQVFAAEQPRIDVLCCTPDCVCVCVCACVCLFLCLCMCLCLNVCHFVCLPLCLSVCISLEHVCLCLCLSLSRSLSLPVSVSFSLCLSLSLCLSVSLSLSLSLSVSLSVSLSLSLSLSASVSLCFSVSVSVFLCLCLSVCFIRDVFCASDGPQCFWTGGARAGEFLGMETETETSVPAAGGCMGCLGNTALLDSGGCCRDRRTAAADVFVDSGQARKGRVPHPL